VSTAWQPGDKSLEISVDCTLGHGSVCVTIECDDRQGIIYDVLREVHNSGIQATQVSCHQGHPGRSKLLVFLKDAVGGKLNTDLLQPLLHRVRKAIMCPVTVSVCPTFCINHCSSDGASADL
jgi:predicted regulator of amino acid metabolism with ACT domain